MMTDKKFARDVLEELVDLARTNWAGKDGERLAIAQALLELQALLPREEEIKFLEEVSKRGKEMLAICERERFVFDNLKNRWQKLAFTFYSEIVALSIKAEAILADCREAIGGER